MRWKQSIVGEAAVADTSLERPKIDEQEKEDKEDCVRRRKRRRSRRNRID